MMIKGVITQVSDSGFVVNYRENLAKHSAVVPFPNCPFCVGVSVAIKGAIYNSRYLAKDFTYKEQALIRADKVEVTG